MEKLLVRYKKLLSEMPAQEELLINDLRRDKMYEKIEKLIGMLSADPDIVPTDMGGKADAYE